MTKENVKKMIRRKELLRAGGDENEEMADAILEEVLQNGGLTAEEVYAVMASSGPAGKMEEDVTVEEYDQNLSSRADKILNGLNGETIALSKIANRENVQEQVIRAKKALAERDFSTYWNTVYGIVALIGGSDDGDEKEDDYIDMVNRKLGGPGT